VPNSDRLLAWIEKRDGDEFEAAFVAAATRSRRAPATQCCPSLGDAKRWVEDQADALGVSVDWVDRPTKR
jgi:hypothetical protein